MTSALPVLCTPLTPPPPPTIGHPHDPTSPPSCRSWVEQAAVLSAAQIQIISERNLADDRLGTYAGVRGAVGIVLHGVEEMRANADVEGSTRPRGGCTSGGLQRALLALGSGIAGERWVLFRSDMKRGGDSRQLIRSQELPCRKRCAGNSRAHVTRDRGDAGARARPPHPRSEVGGATTRYGALPRDRDRDRGISSGRAADATSRREDHVLPLLLRPGRFVPCVQDVTPHRDAHLLCPTRRALRARACRAHAHVASRADFAPNRPASPGRARGSLGLRAPPARWAGRDVGYASPSGVTETICKFPVPPQGIN